MKNASVRDLRYNFPRIENILEQGEAIAITKRKRVIARLIPVGASPAVKRPDFLKRLHQIYGKKKLKVTGAELLSRQRDQR